LPNTTLKQIKPFVFNTGVSFPKRDASPSQKISPFPPPTPKGRRGRGIGQTSRRRPEGGLGGKNSQGAGGGEKTKNLWQHNTTIGFSFD